MITVDVGADGRHTWEALVAANPDSSDVVVIGNAYDAARVMPEYDDPDCWMTHGDVLSFRGFLWDQIEAADLQRDDGSWCEATFGQVVTRQLLEMSGPNFRVIGDNPHPDVYEDGSLSGRQPKPQMYLFDGGLCMHWRDRCSVILDYLTEYGIGTVVETGTADGATAEVVAASDLVRRWWTVEADADRARITAQRLRGNGKIYCLTGTSPDTLHDLVTARQLDGQVLWWLDAHLDIEDAGHPSNVTPIVDELGIVMARQTADVVLIDDARLFGTYPGYPTIDEVRGLVDELGERHGIPYAMTVRHDIIRLVPSDRSSLTR